MNRRRFIKTGALALATVTQGCVTTRKSPEKSSLAQAFDLEMEPFMAARKVPGGPLAVVKDRRLVYARGYGWADRDKKIPVKPDSLFRIASVSKPITAVAVLNLVEEGKLDLDARAFGVVRLPPVLETGRPADPRLGQITI